jgi:uncharacterized DUF497 family protein
MNIVYHLQGIEVEWDSQKAEALLVSAFSFIMHLCLQYFTNSLLVIFVERNQRTRIISARRVTRYEQRLYEQS